MRPALQMGKYSKTKEGEREEDVLVEIKRNTGRNEREGEKKGTRDAA